MPLLRFSTHNSSPAKPGVLITNNWRQRRLGFTLVELLIAISIIAIISSVGYVNFNSAQEKSRDSARKTDLKAIKTALVSYYQDNEVYPGNFGTDYLSNSSSWIPGLTPSYIQKLPTDQKAENYYLYKISNASGKDFELWAQLDKTNDQEAYNQPNAICKATPPAANLNYCLEAPQ